MNNTIKRIVCVLYVPLLIASFNKAYAQENLYLKIETGIAYPTKFNNVEDYNNQKPSNSLSYGIGLGYATNDFSRFDISFIKLHKFKFNKIVKTNSIDIINQKSSSSLVMFNYYFDFKSNFTIIPYLTLGLGACQNKAGNYYVGSEDSYLRGRLKNNFAWNVGAGIQKKINRQLDLDFGYKYFNLGEMFTSQSLYMNGKFVSSSVPEVKVNFRVHTLSLAIKYYF
jgi:opacity protein-like surface antigen